MDLTADVISIEANHEATGVGPRLAAEVAQVRDLYACFLHHFTMDGFLERFTGLHEACHESVELRTEVAGVYQQYLVTAMNKHDDGSGQLGPYLFSALGAAFGDVGVHLHGAATDAAEAGVHIPIEQFVALACLQVFFLRQLVVALAQAAHLVAVFVGHWQVDGQGLVAFNVQDMCPRLDFYRCLVALGNGVAAVSVTSEQQLVFTKDVVFHVS